MTENILTHEDRLKVLEKQIDTAERRKTGIMEAHAQTIIVFVILAVLSWVGYSILETGKEISLTNTSIAVMKADMSHMKISLDNANSRYVTKVEYTITHNQVAKDLLELRARVLTMEHQRLEAKPEKL